MAAMFFKQVQRFILAKKTFLGYGHFKFAHNFLLYTEVLLRVQLTKQELSVCFYYRDLGCKTVV